RRNWSPVQFASAGECNRKLRENCPACAGKDCSRNWRKSGPKTPARDECRSRRIPEMSTAALTLDQDIWRPRYNPWLVAVVVALAAFMEVLDTSIANVALPYMAGNLGASNDQSTWVLTSYLVSNAIILPMTGWLAGAFGRKRFFMSCLGIF